MTTPQREHGTRRRYRTDHCRCTECTDANREACRSDRATIKAAKIDAGTFVDGRIAANRDRPRTLGDHGTQARYRAGCRDVCCLIPQRQRKDASYAARGLTPGGRIPKPPKAPSATGPGGNTGSPRVSQRKAVVTMERKRAVLPPARFVPTRIDQCGEPTSPIAYCVKPFPCVIHTDAVAA